MSNHAILDIDIDVTDNRVRSAYQNEEQEYNSDQLEAKHDKTFQAIMRARRLTRKLLGDLSPPSMKSVSSMSSEENAATKFEHSSYSYTPRLSRSPSKGSTPAPSIASLPGSRDAIYESFDYDELVDMQPALQDRIPELGGSIQDPLDNAYDYQCDTNPTANDVAPIRDKTNDQINDICRVKSGKNQASGRKRVQEQFIMSNHATLGINPDATDNQDGSAYQGKAQECDSDQLESFPGVQEFLAFLARLSSVEGGSSKDDEENAVTKSERSSSPYTTRSSPSSSVGSTPAPSIISLPGSGDFVSEGPYYNDETSNMPSASQDQKHEPTPKARLKGLKQSSTDKTTPKARLKGLEKGSTEKTTPKAGLTGLKQGSTDKTTPKARLQGSTEGPTDNTHDIKLECDPNPTPNDTVPPQEKTNNRIK
ncbi:hypothetical protein AMATHDRAFT_49265 [Amanita thiersii Skay4041]|uniref:Uncharacterized protein n=1 Tax=Amanita thiersii Skay4041 TaxID=703135 RepID=A0A2A9NM26_9AGAR|nr:hypothetical protein AMATHDRAFT_49265 [Amanita thiersii Skay4041]